ncbi:MAG: aminotransferase class V-fold PLP-dependent enzyme [Clostridia bacterium]|nr:aminotransferase class V-fold PLP-dependent enzyme [Clostridia bacterium]
MIYLDNAATSRYVPVEVMRAFVQAVNRKANASRGAHTDSVWLGLQIYRVREEIRRFVDNPAAEVVFTKNCTEALNLAIRSVPAGAHVVTTVTEHNSVLRPLHEMQRKGLITLSLASPASPAVGVTRRDVERHIRADTRLVVLNHVSNVTGIANDVSGVGELCAERAVPYLVDAAQSVGHFPLSMRRIGCDMLAAPAHKGLHGLQGVGFLVFNKTVRVNPLLYGGTGTDSVNVYQPMSYPEGLEAGTLDGAGVCALGAGLRWTAAHLSRVEDKETRFVARLAENLRSLEGLRVYSGVSGVVSIYRKGLSSAYLADKLSEAGVATRAGLHCAPLLHRFLGTRSEGMVRFSAGYVNRLHEADRVADLVAYCLRHD